MTKISDPAEVIYARVVEHTLRRDAAAIMIQQPKCTAARLMQAAETIAGLCDLVMRQK